VPSSRTNRADLVKLNLLTVKNGSKQIAYHPANTQRDRQNQILYEIKLFYAVLNEADITAKSSTFFLA
jgi:hypothetical protein